MFDVRTLNISVAQQPRPTRLIVLPLIQASHSFLVDMEEDRELPMMGLVLACGGDGVGPETGEHIPQLSKVGELVCFGKFSGLKWMLSGQRGPVKVFIMNDYDVLLSQPPETLEMVIHDGDPAKIHLAGLTCEHCDVVKGEAGLDRLRQLAAGVDPDAVTTSPLSETSPLL